MSKINKNIVRILEYELSNYHQYKMQLAAFANRCVVLGIEEPKTSAYVYRIERFCCIVDSILNDMPKMKCELINQVYFHKIYTIQRFSIMNYIDVSSAYRWRSDFFERLAMEMGY